ncbi:MAG: glycosyltransferase, partial [Thaumarchaeota archaeon]|nr:glycosyltransferase [Nitrososphaerota archaeon]
KRLVHRKDIHFVIAGTEQGQYGKEVREEADELPNVSVLGSISDIEKSALIKATSINLILSRSEALGITQLEFMSNGVPVVSSGAGGQQWVVRDGENGIVLDGPDDIVGGADAVLKLVDDEPLRKRLGRNAIHSTRGFSMTRLTHALAKRLEGLARERSDDERLRRSMASDEQALEAMISGKLKVIVTNRRLLVKDDHDGGETISIPLEGIWRITRHKRLSWDILGAGCGAAFLLFVAMLALPLHFGGLIYPAAGEWLLLLASVIPLTVAAPMFLLRIRDGYSIDSTSGQVFLPRRFLRLLKLVDRLTEIDFFEEEADPQHSEQLVDPALPGYPGTPEIESRPEAPTPLAEQATPEMESRPEAPTPLAEQALSTGDGRRTDQA